MSQGYLPLFASGPAGLIPAPKPARMPPAGMAIHCAGCKHSQAIGYGASGAIGYYACALQASWLYRTHCDNFRFEAR